MAKGVLAAGLTLVLTAAVALFGVPVSALAATGDVPFASAPVSKPITCAGRTTVTISGHTFRDLDDTRPAIAVIGCRNVVIEHNDFLRVAEPIYVFGSRNVAIRHNRYRDITGPYLRNGSHRGNFVQLDHTTGATITDNAGVGGDTEDVISLYFSGGASKARPLVIARNRFQGTNWRSRAGAGILVGDGGGGHVVVRDNVLANVGQVGIGIAGGSDVHVLRNTVFGPKRVGSNVGIYAWAQGAACRGIEVAENRVDFTNESGSPSSMWDGRNCGRIAGWSTNRSVRTMRASALTVHF